MWTITLRSCSLTKSAARVEMSSCIVAPTLLCYGEAAHLMRDISSRCLGMCYSCRMESTKPDKHEYYMDIAATVAERADCTGTKVGAVVVVGDRIVSTGYNGAPDGVTNCSDGGCPRCRARQEDMVESGDHLDKCLCVHAEENAILSAARHGIALENCSIYTTVQPCLGCLRQLIQIRAQTVYYVSPFPMQDLAKDAYLRLCKESHLSVQPLRWEPKQTFLPTTAPMDDTLDAMQEGTPSHN